MIDYEQLIAQFEQKSEQSKHYSYFFLKNLTQSNTGEDLKVEVTGLRSDPAIYVKNKSLAIPQPVFLKHYHDDSDDDLYSPEAYEENNITCFYIDPETGNTVSVIHCSDTNSLPSVVEDNKFYRISPGEKDEEETMEEISFLPDRQHYCRYMKFSINNS